MSMFDRLIVVPTALSGCVLWLDAMDASTITTDATGSVSQWNDKSGRGNNVTQSDNTRRPEYRRAAFNGYPCVDWNTGSVSARVLTTSNNISMTSLTIFTVCRGDASSGYLFVHNGNSSAGHAIWASTGPSIRVGRGFISDKDVSVSWLRDSVKKIVVTRYDGKQHASNLSWVNGAMSNNINRSVAGTFDDSDGRTTTGPIYIGNDQTPANTWRGVIAEVIVFSRNLSDAERVLIERYLNKKWGLYSERV